MSALDPWLARAGELRAIAPPVIVACSGGADSMAMLALAQASGLLPVATHVDHGLRPGSEGDAVLVRAAAERLGTRFRSTRVQVDAGSNLEARARAARYEALERVRRTEGATAVLVGHTMDDQAETVLLNLLRGAASTGLGAMAPRSGSVVRPLLELRRSETEEICAALGLEVLRDPMNEDPSFRRVWIRTEALPALCEGARRDLVPVLARQADILRDESAFLDALAAASWPRGSANASELAALAPPIARRAVRCWLGAPPPRRDEVDEVLAVARGERRATELAGRRRVWRRRGVMRHGTDHPARGYGVGASAAGSCGGEDDDRAEHMSERRRDGYPDEQRAWPERPGPKGREREDQSERRRDGYPDEQAGDGPNHRDDPNLGRIVVGEDELRSRVVELGKELTADYGDRPPLLVGVLKGAFMFMSDLARAIALPVDFDFMAVSSYGSATRTSGVVRIIKDLDVDLSGRHVLIVEDVVDSGLTLAYLRKNLVARDPASVEVCALLVKDGLQRVDPGIRYEGFRIPPVFVVGYGLDVGEHYRNLPYLAEYTGPDTSTT